MADHDIGGSSMDRLNACGRLRAGSNARSRVSGYGALFAAAALAFLSAEVSAAPPASADPPDKDQPADAAKGAGKFESFKSESKTSTGSVVVGGQTIAYQAVAGTWIVHPKGGDDAPSDTKSDKEEGSEGEGHNSTAEASMFYVAYFKNNGGTARAVSFFYKRGPADPTLVLA